MYSLSVGINCNIRTNRATRFLGACGDLGQVQARARGQSQGPGLRPSYWQKVALHSCPSGRELLRSRRLPGTLQTALPATAESSYFSHFARRDHRDTETTERRHQLPSCVPLALCMAPLALPPRTSPSPLAIPSLDPHRPLEHAQNAFPYLVRILQLILWVQGQGGGQELMS